MEPTTSLSALRELRARAMQIKETLLDDMEPFAHTDGLTFRRLPDSKSKKDASVATTCSVLMAFSALGLHGKYYDAGEVEHAVARLMTSLWDSSMLPKDNAFTRIVMLRTLGILVDHQIIRRDVAIKYRKNGKTIEAIAKELASGLPTSLSVLEYDPTPTLGYWFVDAVERLKLKLPQGSWTALAGWARRELTQHVTLIAAQHEARMDPVALAMAACLAARLRRLALDTTFKTAPKLMNEVPSQEELRTAVRILFRHQGESGIWPKYFPLFHYPDAGANHCFSFELLEAIVHEFGRPEDGLIDEPLILAGLERAIAWCEKNRLQHVHEKVTYRGWNSGGQLATLAKGIPESWATAVVHMFARELEIALTRTIAEHVLNKYEARRPKHQDSGDWDKFLDIAVTLRDERKTSVKKILEDELLTPIEERPLSKHPKLDHRRAALLFGPPGTSKTSLVRGLAAKLGWPYVEITPSHFMRRGLEQIPIQADEIFADLIDLSDAVILFDEMDAMVKRRDATDPDDDRSLDPTSELLTTSMLPKLAELYGKKQAAYFFATNHRRGLDSAITRPGRFDIWICVGPPTWKEKLKKLEVIAKRFEVSKNQVDSARRLLEEWTEKAKPSNDLTKALDRFTFAEVQSLLEHACSETHKKKTEIGTALTALTKEKFVALVQRWEKDLIVLRERDGDKENGTRTEYEKDRKLSCLQ